MTGDMVGEEDILVLPLIEAENILYKSLMYFSNAKVCAIIQGGKSPIVLKTKAVSAESKLYSIAMAILSTKNERYP